VSSRDIRVLDGAVLVPLVAVIGFLAFYPQFALKRSERSVQGAVYDAQFTAALGRAPRSASDCPPAYLQRFEEVKCPPRFALLTYERPNQILVIK
jgi:hypothetical protein